MGYNARVGYALYRAKLFFTSGGFVLAPLLLLSVYSLALIWERRTFYKRRLGGLERFLGRIEQCLASGNLKDAVALCRQRPGPPASILLVSLTGPVDKEERRKAAEREIEKSLAALERHLPVLGTVGSVSPFIGLLGTVLGVMRAFKDLAHATGSGPGVVAAGISEALIATAAGLFVAIPAVVAYNYFTTRSTAFAERMRWLSDEILERLTDKA